MGGAEGEDASADPVPRVRPVGDLGAEAPPDFLAILQDAWEIRSACGFMWMRMAVAENAQDAFEVGKREFTEHEAAFQRLETSLPKAIQFLRAADAPRAHPSDVLLMALKRVTAGMDRAGHMDGWPECPWCHDAGSDDIHAPECELLLARQVIADVEHGIGAVSRPHPETPNATK